MKTRSLFIYIFIFLLLLSSPFLIWYFKPDKELDVLIMDKTVPNKEYREHRGLTWILNHEKIKKTNGEPYDYRTDYIGFHPKANNEYEITTIPESLSQYDLIYMADQYGVYEREFYGENLEGERSEIIYGGLKEEEVEQIQDSLVKHGGTLISEFNTFATPTEENAREKIYELMNLKWTGWIGRYFYELSSIEVPEWVKKNYEKQQKEEWNFTGPGLVFANEKDKIVLIKKNQFETLPITFQPTDQNSEVKNIKSGVLYQYWFDIIEPNDHNEVLANYELKLSDQAVTILDMNEIPLSFPAVVKHQNVKYTSYYFAGDFADQAGLPDIYQTAFYSWFEKTFSSDEPDNPEAFYWNVYVPLMKHILQNGLHKQTEAPKSKGYEMNGVKLAGNVGSDYLQIYKDGQWQDVLIKGVNIGMAKPGTFPGEAAIDKEEYFRWFKHIGEMNANAIRVYTLHPPGFYEAFYEYNQIAEEPLFLFHGAWVIEEDFHSTQNAFSPEVTESFKKEIKKITDVVHGNAEIVKVPGHAGGKYEYNISDYMLGWIIGIEWDPNVVQSTINKNLDKQEYNGRFFKTQEANPFEVWVASMMDYTAKYEMDNYKVQRPMSFTNWVTTDLLSHPSEPLEEEDLVSVDPNHILAKESYYPGVFASYHIYPYYPDFLNYEEKYTSYIDYRGERNSYAGYLNDMIKAHNMPLLVAEFGVPASRGLTHKNIADKDQGFHSEVEQGEINAALFEDIVMEDAAGGLVFTWQDEWFKRTWNTMDYDNPDRRPFWSNLQTNEQRFGLLSFDPGEDDLRFKVDGEITDWENEDVEPLYYSKGTDLEKLFVSSDEAYLYLRIDYNKQITKGELDTLLLLDTIEGQGNQRLFDLNLSSETGTDFIVELNGPDNSRVLIDSYYDSFYYQYGHVLNMIDEKAYANEKNNGIFHPIRLALNKEQEIKTNDGKPKIIPFEAYETGELLFGNADPNSNEYNSLTDVCVNEKEGIVEVRIPWLLLNVKDPSQHELMGDFWSEEGLSSSKQTNGFGIAALVHDGKQVKASLPSIQDHTVIFEKRYLWPKWELPTYHERLKGSYNIMKETFEEMKLGNIKEQ